jgi:hypothetical protein
MVAPACADQEPLLGLHPPVGAQQVQGRVVDVDLAPAPGRLRLPVDNLPAHLAHGLADDERGPVEVDVTPAQTDQLAAP